MPAYLVTGNPGSGKSSVAQEFALRGLPAIDPDHDPELSYWEDAAGARVLLVDGPPDPDQEWLRSHRWVWNRARMKQRLAEYDGSVFVCGIALNIDQFLGVFERIFLLQIDAVTQEARLTAHDAAHPPGRGEAGRQEIRDGRTALEREMLTLGAVAIDGTSPTVVVVDEILAAVAAI